MVAIRFGQGWAHEWLLFFQRDFLLRWYVPNCFIELLLNQIKINLLVFLFTHDVACRIWNRIVTAILTTIIILYQIIVIKWETEWFRLLVGRVIINLIMLLGTWTFRTIVYDLYRCLYSFFFLILFLSIYHGLFLLFFLLSLKILFIKWVHKLRYHKI